MGSFKMSHAMGERINKNEYLIDGFDWWIFEHVTFDMLYHSFFQTRFSKKKTIMEEFGSLGHFSVGPIFCLVLESKLTRFYFKFFRQCGLLIKCPFCQ